MMKLPHYLPWLPVKAYPNNYRPVRGDQLRECDVIAIRAVAEGTANEGQQKMAWAAVQHICGTDDMEFCPAEHGGEQASNFKGGKRFVGMQLRKLVSNPLDLLKVSTDDGSDHDRSTGKPRDDRNSSRARRRG